MLFAFTLTSSPSFYISVSDSFVSQYQNLGTLFDTFSSLAAHSIRCNSLLMLLHEQLLDHKPISTQDMSIFISNKWGSLEHLHSAKGIR